MVSRKGKLTALVAGAGALAVGIGFVAAFWTEAWERWHVWKLESESAAEREAGAVWLEANASPAVVSRLSAIVEEGTPEAAGVALRVIWNVLSQRNERARALSALVDRARLRKPQGIVREVAPAESLLLLSIGRDQGIELGDVFVIRREEEVVGDAKVIKVFPDLSGCEFKESPGTSGVRKGDKAIGLVTGR